MIARTTATLLIFLSTPAFAQDYETMGSVTATVDGADMEFCVPYLVEEGEAHAEITGPVKSMGSCLWIASPAATGTSISRGSL